MTQLPHQLRKHCLDIGINNESFVKHKLSGKTSKIATRYVNIPAHGCFHCKLWPLVSALMISSLF